MKNAEGINILIVDDNKDNLIALKGALRRPDINIIPATSGHEALELMLHHDFSLALLDVQMPGLSGFETAELMRKNPTFKEVPIIFITAMSVEDNYIYRGYDAGAYDYLCKPIDPELLRRKVDVFLLLEMTRRNLNKTIQELESEVSRRKRAEIQQKLAQKRKANLERQLKQSQKMAAIGTLAGGIAHDFNNILFPIMAYTELLMKEFDLNPTAQKNMERILIASHRAKDLVQQILTFSRQGNQVLKPIRLQTVIKESLKLLRASIPTNIEILHHMDPSCKTVMGDSTQIHQIMMNLCTNAYHAMQETGGKIEVSLKEVAITPEDLAEKPGLKAGKYALLAVSDTGHGIKDKDLELIFDPYYTTKAKGRGTGLGLSVVHGIVNSYGGTICVSSALNRGTTFRVYLPLTDTVVTETETGFSETIPRGKERILLVDDEEFIVQVLTQILERLGYEVIGVSNSHDALEKFRLTPYRFDLVITDMTMPGMTGKELAKRLSKMKNDIPIILCTGFTNQISDEELINLPYIREYLMKPIGMDKLATTVRKVLDNKFRERREHKRFKIQNGVVTLPGLESQQSHRLIDISKGGLSFYLNPAEILPGTVSELTLQLADQNICLEKLPCKPVSSFSISDTSLSANGKMRFSVQFKGLVPDQIAQVENFIYKSTFDKQSANN